MGEKKRKEAEVARWKKVVVVAACVIFVVLMVVSGMGFGWLSMFAVTKPGQTVVLDYTIYDGSGNPVITTDQQVYTTAASAGKPVLYTQQIVVVANQTMTEPIYPVPVYTSQTGSESEFAIFAMELNAITSGVVGMSTNQQKTVALPASSSMSQLWSAEDLEKNGIDMNSINVGDQFAMGVSDNPEEMATNESAKTFIRISEVIRKTDGGIVVDFSYPKADIRVVSINN